tara:strand:+ start:18665 stop:18772 length:108 start_codon:yes stop_codon:yes gene_type:complete
MELLLSVIFLLLVLFSTYLIVGPFYKKKDKDENDE